MIKPLHDWIVLKRHDYAHKTLYVHGQKTHRGTVIAVGPGRRLKKFIEVEDPINGKKFRTRAGNETGYRKPVDITPGDIVEYSDAGWEERVIDGEKYIFTRQDSVIGFSDSTDPEGLQGHASPDIDRVS